MKIKETTSKKLYKEFDVQIPFEIVDISINKKINEIIPTVTLPGFRKGKAPINLVKKKYENNVLNEVLEKIVQEKTNEVLKEKKLSAYRQPKVEINKYKRNEPVELVIKIDLQPEINIFPFSKIKLINYSIEVDKKSIEDNYKFFLESQKKYIKLTKNRSLKKGDKVFVNIKSTDESVPDYFKLQKELINC